MFSSDAGVYHVLLCCRCCLELHLEIESSLKMAFFERRRQVHILHPLWTQDEKFKFYMEICYSDIAQSTLDDLEH